MSYLKVKFKLEWVLIEVIHTYIQNVLCLFCRDCAMAIVNSDQWNEALKFTYQISGSSEVTTPFRELIKTMPGKCKICSYHLDS